MCRPHPQLALIVALLTCASADPTCIAADEGPEDLLTTWRNSVRDIDCFAAKVTRWDYDHSFQTVRTTVGELYIEKGNKGRYQVYPTPKSQQVEVLIRGKVYVPRPPESTFIVWTGERALWIDTDNKRYHSAPTAMYESLLTMSPRTSAKYDASRGRPPRVTPLGSIAAGIAALASPRQTLPFLALDTYADNDPRFKVVVRSSEERSLTATAKHATDRQRFNDITVIIDRATGLPSATRYIGSSGDHESVHALHDIQIDPPEELRRSMLRPVLDEYVGDIHENEGQKAE